MLSRIESAGGRINSVSDSDPGGSFSRGGIEYAVTPAESSQTRE